MFSRARNALRVLVVAAACATGLLVAGTAHAVPQRVDEVMIFSVPVDFGNGSLNSAGIPSSNGQVDWNLVGGRWEPRVIGKIWVSAAPYCVRIQLVVGFTTGGSVTFTDNTSDFCTTTVFTTHQYVDFAPFGSANIAWVIVVLQGRANLPNTAWQSKGGSLPLWAP